MSTSIRLIRKPTVLNRIGHSNAWLYKKIAEGAFPQPVKLGARAVAWVESEVEEWILARIEERDGRRSVTR
ncbi:MAG: helix-turn-helix transcriptional regulator [Porticoccaceae bacterium]|jgi:prophage regulatory protein